MCFDTEKTQAPRDGRVDKQMRDVLAAKNREANAMHDAGYAIETAMPGRALSDSEIIAELFKYHAPTREQLPLYAAINQAAKNFAEVILSTCPRGADRAVAINCLRNARMFANAAISVDGLSL